MTESQTTHQNEGKLKTVVDLISNAIQPALDIWEQFNFQEEDQGNQAKDYWEIDPEVDQESIDLIKLYNWVMDVRKWLSV